MTANAFRRAALSLPYTEERQHMWHPDFRVGGKIFATLGYPDGHWAMVKLTPEQQEEFVAADRKMFVAVKGAWGRQGCTNVRLAAAKKTALEQALRAAWEKAKAESAPRMRKSAGNR